MAWQRHKVEANNRTVAISVVYDEVASLARAKELSPPEDRSAPEDRSPDKNPTVKMLEAFKDSGATTVLIKEPTVLDAEANGELVMLTGSEMLLPSNAALKQQFVKQFQEIKPYCRYLIIFDSNTYKRVLGQLQKKNVRIQHYFEAKKASDVNIIEVYPNPSIKSWSDFEQIGLGFPDQAFEDVYNARLKAMVQVRSWAKGGETEDGLDHVFGRLKEIQDQYYAQKHYQILSGVLFNDPVLPGYSKQIRHLYDLIMKDIEREQDKEKVKKWIPLVQIEFTDQKGLSTLGLLMDKKVVRLHTMSQEEYNKLGTTTEQREASALDRFALAASERNIRVLLLHTYIDSDVTDIQAFNSQLVQKTSAKLNSEGLQVGEPSVLGSLKTSWLLFVMGLGVIAGAMLLALTWGWTEVAIGIGIFGLLAWTGMLAVDMVTPARKIMAFLAALVFPVLSITVNVRQSGAPVGKSILLLLRTCLYSLVGALLMVGLLADISFMLTMNRFSGVKLVHIAPLLIFAIFFYFRGEIFGGSWQRKLQRLWDKQVLVKLLLVGGILLVALLYYLNRTGNEIVAISPLELHFRTWLDNILGVRPRTKEFLLGHPLMLLLIYLGYRNNNYIPLLLGGAIGQISLVNTYAHIHTPLVISLVRSFHGLWLGILIGLVLIALWRIGENLVYRWDWLRELMIRD